MDGSGPEESFRQYKAWVKSLRCKFSTPLEADALVNCRSFAELLHMIDDVFFPEDWIELIVDYKKDEDWRLKAANLDKLLERIQEYLELHAAIKVNGVAAWSVNPEAFAIEHSLRDLNKVLGLIMACAFMGVNKEDFNERIDHQPEELQTFVYRSVSMVRTSSEKYTPLLPQMIQSDEYCTVSSGGGDRNFAKEKEMETEIENLKQNQRRLECELSSAKQKLNEYHSDKSLDYLETENKELRKYKHNLEDKLLATEAILDTYKSNCSALEEELENLREKTINLHLFEEDYRKMKDEIGELKIKECELIRISRELDALKQKHLDAFNNRSDNIIRCDPTKYVQDFIELEDEKSRNKALKQHIAELKAEKDDLERKAEKNFMLLAKVESALADAREKLVLAEHKNHDLTFQKKELQEKVNELEFDLTRENTIGFNSLVSELEMDRRFSILETPCEVTILKEEVDIKEKIIANLVCQVKQLKEENDLMTAAYHTLASSTKDGSSRPKTFLGKWQNLTIPWTLAGLQAALLIFVVLPCWLHDVIRPAPTFV